MKPVLRRILMLLADAAMLMFGYYVSYYLIGFIGRECTDVFITNAYIFAAVKLAVFAVFFMYSLKPDRSFLLDVAGIVVANAAAIALGIFLYKVDLLSEILVISIVLAWDLVIGLMIRFLFRNPEEDEDEEPDDEFYLSHDDDLTQNDILPTPETNYVQDAAYDASANEPEGAQPQETPQFNETANNPFENTASFNAEIQAKLDAMLKLMEEKDSKIDMLENKLALQSEMDFESFAPEEEAEEEPQDIPEETPPPKTETRKSEDTPAPDYYAYAPQQNPYTPPQQQYDNIYAPQNAAQYMPQPQMYAPNPYQQQQQQQNYVDKNKKEIIESILSDIKDLYSTLSSKTKDLDERERNLLMRTIELEQREKTLDKLETEARAAAGELRAAAIESKKPMSREISDDMLLPRDNLQLADSILKTLDDIKKKPSPPFVLAEAPTGEKTHNDEFTARIRPDMQKQTRQNTNPQNRERPIQSPPNYDKQALAERQAAEIKQKQQAETAAKAQAEAEARARAEQQARIAAQNRAAAEAKARIEAEAKAKAKAKAEADAKAEAAAKEKARAEAEAKKKAAAEKAKREEELARIQQQRLKNAITPKSTPAAAAATVENKTKVDFGELENDELNLNVEDLDNISSFLDNL